MEKTIKIKAYYPGIAITEKGDVYTWFPLDQGQIFPKKIAFKLLDNLKILNTSGTVIICLNEQNEVLCFDINKNQEIRPRLTLPIQDQSIEKIKVSDDLLFIIVLLSDQTLLMFEFNVHIIENEKFVSKYIEFKESPLKIQGKINAIAISNKWDGGGWEQSKAAVAILTDNEKLLLIGEVSEVSKHVRSSRNMFTFTIQPTSTIKDMEFYYDAKKSYIKKYKIAFKLNNNQIVCNENPLDMNETINLIPKWKETPFPLRLNSLNSSTLTDFFLIDEANEVFYRQRWGEFNHQNRIKFSLNENEIIIDIKDLYARTDEDTNTAYILTNQGNLYGFGNNREFQLGNGKFTEFEAIAVHMNPLFDKKISNDEYLALYKEYISLYPDYNEKIEHYFPNDLKTDYEKLFELLILTNFEATLNRKVQFTFDQLKTFIEKRPDLKYKILTLFYSTFIDVDKLPILINIFPEIVFLFADKEFTVEQFTYYLTPLLKPFSGQAINAEKRTEIFKNIEEILKWDRTLTSLGGLKDRLNFHLALLNFNFQYDYLTYEEIHEKYLTHGYQNAEPFISKIPAKLKDQILSTCSIDTLPSRVTMNELVETLVINDLIILSERLIKEGKLSKSKFLAKLTKNPSIFSLRFKSFLLAAPKIEKAKKIMGLNIDDLQAIQSKFNYNATYFFDKESLYVSGNSNVMQTKKRKENKLSQPFFMYDIIRQFSPSRIINFTSNNENFVFINEENQFFWIGRAADKIHEKNAQLIQMNTEDISWFEFTKILSLHPNERIISLSFLTEYREEIIFLTNQSRVLVINAASKFLSDKLNNKSNGFVVHDLTENLALEKDSQIKKMDILENELIIYQTSHDKLFYYRDGLIGNITVPLTQGDKIKDFKLGNFGLLVMTIEGKLYSTQINIENNIEVLSWNYHRRVEEEDSYKNFYEEDQFNLDELTIPLEENESIIQWDIHYSHAMVITSKGKVFLWGEHKGGALGSIPFRFTNILDVNFLKEGEKVVNGFLGKNKTFIITNKNRLFAFGSNRTGSLGDGTEVDRFLPIDITSKFKRGKV